jgi:hypothetical protein
LAALSNPLDAINQLFAKIAELERRIGIIEKLLGIGGENKTEGERENFPYSFTLNPELIGKIEGSFSYKVFEWHGPEGPTLSMLYECKIKNLFNQTITELEFEVIGRDATGKIIVLGKGGIGNIPPSQERKGGWQLLIEEPLKEAGIEPTFDAVRELKIETIITLIKFD